MEGILNRALALVGSVYCNLFPSPDVHLSKHGNAHPPLNISSGRYMFTWTMVDTSNTDGDMWGEEGGVGRAGKKKKGKEEQADRAGDVRHMLAPADDTRMTRRSKWR